ncbi:hypothetical protein DQ04_04281070 [Trypanosoma grayi]|uniref:hypothetical protein n=1 Tax=Trypanosoma grayi TaxID=71804 RepID=UPI0004F467BF|nr:hypothetical protein DQ04_04281070 [Trypanosoma grayi]KEG10031.1 hypothetical protein DQ04_04281070 [Trypanosoma grayi]
MSARSSAEMENTRANTYNSAFAHGEGKTSRMTPEKGEVSVVSGELHQLVSSVAAAFAPADVSPSVEA